MCVAITLAPGTDLSLQEVERMNRANADGVGVAWAREGIVQWYKTTKVDPQYIMNMIAAWKDYPRLVHFRYATAGGTRPDLCHPFEIGPLATCKPVGTSTKVMIHNGHWSRWSDVKDLLDKEGLLPPGPWSDSRLAAYLAHMDPDWLSALGGRVAIMTGDGEIHRLGDWTVLRPGVVVSNKSWDTSTTYTRGGYSGFRNWKGWAWSEEETKAFFEEEAKREEEELEAQIKAAEAKSKETRGQKKQRKREERRAEKRSAEGGASCDDSTVRAERTTQPLGVPVVPTDLEDLGSDGTSGFAGTAATQSRNRTCDPTPYQAKNGKWYAAVKIRGATEVVEVAAPGSSSPSPS